MRRAGRVIITALLAAFSPSHALAYQFSSSYPHHTVKGLLPSNSIGISSHVNYNGHAGRPFRRGTGPALWSRRSAGLLEETTSKPDDVVGGARDEVVPMQREPMTRRQLKDELIRASCGVALLSLPIASSATSTAPRVESTGRKSEVQPGQSGQIIRGGAPLPPIGARTKRILLARHGQTDYNALMVCQGRRLDPPLNYRGRMQARHLLSGADVQAIFCSPLARAQETASIVHESHTSASVSVCDELNEIDFGGAEGLPMPLAAAFLASTYSAWSEGRYDKRAGGLGEDGETLRRRSVAAAQKLLGACDYGGQVLGVSHSAMLKFLLATLLNLPLSTIRKFGQDNCSVNALDFDTSTGAFEAVVINGLAVRGRAELMALVA